MDKQIEEIKKLQEELSAAYENRVIICKQLAEQKAEIERLKIELKNEKIWGKIQTKQAVKDTAKEILQIAIPLSDMCESFYEFQNRFIDLIEVIYGIEVETKTIIRDKNGTK